MRNAPYTFLAITLSLNLIACVDADSKIVGCWITEDGIKHRYDADGLYATESDFARFAAPWRTEPGGILVTSGYIYVLGTLETPEERYRFHVEDNVLTLTEVGSGKVSRYSRCKQDDFTWRPSMPKPSTVFEVK